MSQPREESQLIEGKGGYDRPEANPATQHYFENTQGLIAAPAGVAPWVVELARVVIPESWVGVIKSFEEVAIHEDVASPLYFSRSDSWGNPFVIPSTVTVRFHIRIERCDAGEPAYINAVAPVPEILLPGEAHPDWPWTDDLWFPAASAVGQNIHVTVGSGYRMRVIAIVRRTVAYDVSLAVRIRGFRQSAYDPMTKLALRSIW
ncbi:MAG: hypothetical protein PHD68_02260 [Rugosibacter sp.]|nr:hypothetical protein [Rugosibacter sp.]